jgi:hypothetical protein
MRKILYSPGYGAGWSTWNSGEVARFMLVYQPIIDFIEGGNSFTNDDTDEKTIHPLLKQLQDECREKFGKEYVCMLGADDLEIFTTNKRVRISEYDGFESIEEEGEFEEWL